MAPGSLGYTLHDNKLVAGGLWRTNAADVHSPVYQDPTRFGRARPFDVQFSHTTTKMLSGGKTLGTERAGSWKPMQCWMAEELEKKGAAALRDPGSSLKIWHEMYPSRPMPKGKKPSPVVFDNEHAKQMGRGQALRAHLKVEHFTSDNADDPNVHLGDEGYLAINSVSDWLKTYGEPCTGTTGARHPLRHTLMERRSGLGGPRWPHDSGSGRTHRCSGVPDGVKWHRGLHNVKEWLDVQLDPHWLNPPLDKRPPMPVVSKRPPLSPQDGKGDHDVHPHAPPRSLSTSELDAYRKAQFGHPVLEPAARDRRERAVNLVRSHASVHNLRREKKAAQAKEWEADLRSVERDTAGFKARDSGGQSTEEPYLARDVHG